MPAHGELTGVDLRTLEDIGFWRADFETGDLSQVAPETVGAGVTIQASTLRAHHGRYSARCHGFSQAGGIKSRAWCGFSSGTKVLDYVDWLYPTCWAAGWFYIELWPHATEALGLISIRTHFYPATGTVLTDRWAVEVLFTQPGNNIRFKTDIPMNGDQWELPYNCVPLKNAWHWYALGIHYGKEGWMKFIIDDDVAVSLNNICLDVLAPDNTYHARTIDDCEANWTASANVVTALDAVDFKEGSNSVKISPAGAFGTGLLAYHNFAAHNISYYGNEDLWIKPSIALDAGDLQLLLDDTNGCVSPVETLDLPALAAGRWHRITVKPFNRRDCSALLSVGLNATVDFGACDINVDFVRAKDQIVYGTDKCSWGITMSGTLGGEYLVYIDDITLSDHYIQPY